MKTKSFITVLLGVFAWSMPIASNALSVAIAADAEAAEPATEKQQSGWRFAFDAKDFLMTIKYYGPEADDRLSLITGSAVLYRKLIEERAKQPGVVAFVASTDEILGWRSAMHGWSGGEVISGKFEPADDYVGYAVEIETGGQPMHAKLGWQLETYDALSLLNACCWRSKSDPFWPLLSSLSDQRRQWAETRYEGLLSHKWHKIIVSTGAGSCWGESCSPKLEVVREGESVRIQPAGTNGKEGVALSEKSRELAKFQDTLHRYAVHLKLHGCCPPNYWKVYKIEMQEKPEQEPKQVFYGYEAVFEPLDGQEFHQWLKEVLKAE